MNDSHFSTAWRHFEFVHVSARPCAPPSQTRSEANQGAEPLTHELPAPLRQALGPNGVGTLARLVNITSPTLPPTAPAAASELLTPTIELPPVPGSPAFSSSSTAEEGGSSPVLPPLPRPQHRINGEVLNLDSTPPRESERGSTRGSNEDGRSEVSRYFTSWGSPLQGTDAASGSHSGEAGREEGKDSDEEEEPLRRLGLGNFQTPFLRPPPSFLRSHTEPKAEPISASVLANRARRGLPSRGLTEDWIRQHTEAGVSEVERLAWLSDNEKDQEEQGYSSLSSSEADLEDYKLEFGQKTPTLKSFLERKDKLATHSRLQSVETVRPGDLKIKKGEKGSKAGSRKVSAALSMTSNGTYETAQQSPAEKKEEDVFGLEGASSIMSSDKPLPDKPLPIPPNEEETDGEKPNKRWSAAALPNIPTFSVTPTDENVQPELPELPKSRAPTPAPRVKKKVPWGRKNISVLLPLDDERGQPGQAPTPLSQREATQMFESWAQLGYNVDGYDLNLSEEGNDAAVYGQSRDMWPQVPDILRERAERQFRVNIPDKSQWDAYVQDLQEAKLRALGVSLGDEDEGPAPLYPPALSRVASGQYPALITSAASNKSSMFSPAMPGAPTGPSSFSGSSASVAQKMLGKLHTSHQSMSFNPSEHPFGSPFSQQQSPVAWSPQNMIYQNMRDRSASVSYGAFSPSSPMPTIQQEGYFPNTPDAAAIQRIQRERTHSLINQSPFGNQFNQPISRQSPRLQELNMDNMSTPGSQHFMPQHKQNLSDSLQKEIEDAEYHLEEQFERQLDHDDYSPHSEKAFDMGMNTPMIPPGFEGLHHPQPHSRGHSLSHRQFGPDSPALQGFDPQQLAHLSEVNSAMGSGAGTPTHMITQSMAQNPWTDEPGRIEPKPRPAHQIHQSKPSMSKLNVSAAPFVFNPAKATEFKPVKLNPAATFTPGKPAFEFPTSNPLNAYVAALPISPPVQHAVISMDATMTTPKQSVTSPIVQFGSGKINAAAPAFTPGGRSFSFTTKVRPDAPVFKPMFSDSGSGGDEPSLRSSIFGKINVAELSKPKSKAIAIVKPVSRDGEDVENDATVYDKDGRVGQPEGRFKRNKGDSLSGDEVPLFATPAPQLPPVEQMPLQETTRQNSPVKGQSPTSDKPVDKENADPSGDENGAPAPPSPAKSVSKKAKRFEDVPDYEGNSWAPVDWADQLESGSSRKHSQSTTPFKIHDEEDEVSDVEKVGSPVCGSNDDHKKHKKNSLSALAKPFEFGQAWSETEKSDAPVSAVKAKMPSLAGSSPTLMKKGLSASRWADPSPSASPDAVSEAEVEPIGDTEPLGDTESEVTQDAEVDAIISSVEEDPAMAELSDEDTFVSELEEGEIRESNPPSADERSVTEPTFEDIDDVMRYMNEDPNMGLVRHTMETPTWRDEAPELTLQMPRTESSPIRLDPNYRARSHAPSPSPGRRYQTSSLGDFDGHNDFSRIHHDPFVSRSPLAMHYAHSPIHHLNDPALSVEPSDWDSVLEVDDEAKFEARSQFFDSHVNDIVGGILAEKLDPIERVLETVQQSLAVIGLSQASSRRHRSSTSADIQESDADDEDDEDEVERPKRRDMSPIKKDRNAGNIEQIRAVILDAFAAQQSRPQTRESDHTSEEILEALNELREQVEEQKLQAQKSLLRTEETAASAGVMAAIGVLAAKVERSLDPDFQGERMRNVVEDVAERRISHASGEKISELEKQLAAMADKLKASEANTEREIIARRQAEDADAKAQRLLRLSRVEEQHVREELGEKEKKIIVLEQTVGSRYSAEDEVRLREAIQHKDEKIMNLEEARSKSANHAKVMETTAQNTQRMLGELEDRIVELDRELSDARQETREWKFETQKAHEITQAKRAEAKEAVAEATALRRTVESLRLQMQESLRVRETFRVKLGQLQERMAAASHAVNQENAQRTKKEAQLVARQEVLDARLEAEAATRDRMMKEIERLEAGEREGIRAVHDNRKLQSVVDQLENKLNEAEKRVLRYKREFEAEREANVAEVERTKTFMQVEVEMAKADLIEAQEEAEKYRMEFEEARESGLSEVGRTKMYMQAEIESANNQVNLVREELEDQVLGLRAEVDHVKMEADTARERHEMLLEDAVVNSKKERATLIREQEDKLEDMQTHYERSLGNAIEDAQRAEQHLLERLSLSSAKTEHLQDRVSHLEEKLELAKEAALAAAEHAKNSRVAAVGSAPYPSDTSMPSKISPQALRESIMVLQEQLQNREECIERLEAQLESIDPDAQTTILKQTSEINWLRELLALRISDLQDIIDTASAPGFNSLAAEAVKGAAIRLKANLQMEEMERERALNGGAGINLPNIASGMATLREAATPRVALVGGKVAQAWSSWRKSATNGRSETPSRVASPSVGGTAQSFLSGFMTPPVGGAGKGKGVVGGRPQLPPQTKSEEERRRQYADDRRLKGGFGASFEHTSGPMNAAQRARQQSRDQRDAVRDRPSPRKEMGRERGDGLGSGSSQSSLARLEEERYAPSERYARSMGSEGTERGGEEGMGERMGQGEGGLEMPMTPTMMRRESYDGDAREEEYSDAGFYDDDESTVDEAMFGASLGR